MLSEKLDEPAPRRFFQKAIKQYGIPEKVMIENSGSNAAAFLESINWQICFAGMIGRLIEVLQIKYLNNIVEQSHRPVKWKMRTALGLNQSQELKPRLQELNCGRCSDIAKWKIQVK